LQHHYNKPFWCFGKVIERIGSVMYNVLLEDSKKLVRIHINQVDKSTFDHLSSSPINHPRNLNLPLDILLEDFGIKDNPEIQEIENEKSSESDVMETVELSSEEEDEVFESPVQPVQPVQPAPVLKPAPKPKKRQRSSKTSVGPVRRSDRIQSKKST
jgi:hypothetical protein